MTSILQTIPQSFYSRRFYQEAVFKHTGVGAFFILISVICVLIKLVGIDLLITHNGLDDVFSPIVRQLPTMTINEGHLSVDAPTPYKIVVGSNSVMVIDPNYKVTDVSSLTRKMSDDHIAVFVTSDQVIYMKSAGVVEIQNINRASNTTITHEQWTKLANWVTALFYPGVCILLFGVLYLAFFFEVLIAAVLVSVLKLFFKLKIPFDASIRLAAASRMPYAILFIVVPPFHYAAFLLWGPYCLFGLWCAAQKDVSLSMDTV